MDYLIVTKVGGRVIRAVRPKIVLEVLNRLDKYIEGRRKRQSWEERRFIVGFLFWTGLRASELLKVRRRDLDIASRLLHAPTLKQRSFVKITISLRHVPNDEIRFWERFLAGKDLDSPIVDIRTRFGVWRAVHDAFKVFGYERVYPHMLRHSIAILLATLGVPLNVLQRFLRHTDPKNTSIYYSISARDMEPYLERVKHRLLTEESLIL